MDAAERTPIVAHIVETLARLRDLAQYAKGSRLNCMQLDGFGQDIMRAFDFHGASHGLLGDLLRARPLMFRLSLAVHGVPTFQWYQQ